MKAFSLSRLVYATVEVFETPTDETEINQTFFSLTKSQSELFFSFECHELIFMSTENVSVTWVHLFIACYSECVCKP